LAGDLCGIDLVDLTDQLIRDQLCRVHLLLDHAPLEQEVSVITVVGFGASPPRHTPALGVGAPQSHQFLLPRLDRLLEGEKAVARDARSTCDPGSASSRRHSRSAHTAYRTGSARRPDDSSTSPPAARGRFVATDVRLAAPARGPFYELPSAVADRRPERRR